MGVHTDNDAENKDQLFHKSGVANYVLGELEVHDNKLSEIKDCNFQLDNDSKNKRYFKH